jgi:biotin synthase
MNEQEITRLLTVSGDPQEELFAEARALRHKAYGGRVVLRGVTEVTNLCRVNCEFCPMRRDNTRYNNIFRLDEATLLTVAQAIKAAGINIVFFQAGEIPQTTRLIGEAIPKIRALFDNDVEILLNLGNKSREEYAYLREQGATSYILKHETSDSVLNERMRHDSYKERLRCLSDLLDLGYRVGTGMIVGLPGQSLESIACDILLAKELGVHMCSASPFVPAPNTPLADAPAGSVEITLNAVAIMRIISPSWLIPSVSALEKSTQGGQLRGLYAGANVITVNFTPETERNRYLIYGKNRYVVRSDYARTMISTAGLQASRSVFVN